MHNLKVSLLDILKKYVTPETAELLRSGIWFLGILIIAIIAYILTRRIIIKILRKVIRHTKNTYDDIFLEKKVFTKLSHLMPGLIIYAAVPLIFKDDINYQLDHESFINFVQGACNIYMVITVLLFVDASLNAWLEIYNRYAKKKNITLSIKGYVQVVKIVFIIIGIILVISVLLGKKPGAIFAGLGALTAVLILIFKDTILGFVASIQLSAYKMVKVGDWITMNSRNADGDVLDISLTTVKVQNFDKTITTIPTYALISESFTNWKGMQDSGGRRIKRTIYIDMNTIKFCSPQMLERFKKIEFLQQYITAKETEIALYNQTHPTDQSIVNGRRLTNIGTFRIYIQKYLEYHLEEATIEQVWEDDSYVIHKKILKEGKFAQGMTLLVRQKEPTDKGLPIEVYVFASTTAWTKYENIQSDLFDHLLAVVPEFDLRVFQTPSGLDMRAITVK